MGIGSILKRIGTGAVRVVSSAGSKAVEKLRQPKYADTSPQRVTPEDIERAMKEQEYLREAKRSMQYERAKAIESRMASAGRKVSRLPGRFVRTFEKKGTGYALAGARTRSGRYSAGRAGRPKGASGRYIIPGVGPVGVYQYRDWMKRQRALDRLRGQQQRMNPQQQFQQPREYPQRQYQPQQMPMPQERYPQPQSVQQMPQQIVRQPSPLGRLNLWDSSVSMTGGSDLNLITPGFGLSNEEFGLFTPFGVRRFND